MNEERLEERGVVATQTNRANRVTRNDKKKEICQGEKKHETSFFEFKEIRVGRNNSGCG